LGKCGWGFGSSKLNEQKEFVLRNLLLSQSLKIKTIPLGDTLN